MKQRALPKNDPGYLPKNVSRLGYTEKEPNRDSELPAVKRPRWRTKDVRITSVYRWDP